MGEFNLAEAIIGSLIMVNTPIPKRILRSGEYTHVFWNDGTKTTVKRMDGDNENVYAAFTAALAIKTYGSNSKVNRFVERTYEIQYRDGLTGKMKTFNPFKFKKGGKYEISD